jgi:hypothetical protein
LGELARTPSNADAPGWIKALGDILGEAEKSHASIELKYQLAKFTLTGQPFDKGALPFQDFALLIEIRNILVHQKPLEASLEKNDSGEFVWTKPPSMRRLHAARIIGVDDSLKDAATRNNADKLIADMVAQISSQAVAQWACRAAAGMVNALLDSVPEGSKLALLMHFAYRREFQL